MGHKLLMSLVLVLVLGGAAGGGYLYYEGQQQPPRYMTAAVERGAIATTVNATGIVNAVTTVQVGTQVSGVIQKLLVDFNSPVKEGEVIAQIASLERCSKHVGVGRSGAGPSAVPLHQIEIRSTTFRVTSFSVRL